MAVDPRHIPALIEKVAAAIYEADEDMNDRYERSENISLGSRISWADEAARHPSTREGYELRARAALRALGLLRP